MHSMFLGADSFYSSIDGWDTTKVISEHPRVIRDFVRTALEMHRRTQQEADILLAERFPFSTEDVFISRSHLERRRQRDLRF